MHTVKGTVNMGLRLFNRKHRTRELPWPCSCTLTPPLTTTCVCDMLKRQAILTYLPVTFVQGYPHRHRVVGSLDWAQAASKVE